jgi:DNA-binding NarL/FixJ family response regulator
MDRPFLCRSNERYESTLVGAATALTQASPPATVVRVAIIAESRVVQEALRTSLAEGCAVDVAGVAALGPEAGQLIESHSPAIVILYFAALGLDDVELIQSMRKRHAAAKLLVLAGSADDASLVKILRAGAKGYLLREAGIADLVKAIHAVDSGEVWVERRLVASLLQTEAVAERAAADYASRGVTEELTSREQEVLRLLATGLANKEIGRTLFISEKTVKTHLSSIFRKLRVGRRVGAVVYAMQGGLGSSSISRRAEADLD